ncbi:hypothetical protein FPF71_00405 [Algibacter amylolyticus]|uniref:T9SS type A sorting domain-containing protein n=1 Tax=Algibacter amylolyticus TaxID=1608400 RepID=A0A5M7BIF6_9FLAO|nr:hypothetical protein [Algibacter amylolyticus]KAA5827341.1 hypothetical protein F2B50_00405 [Algibacter amylolyticus]MBB5266527.1 hypothetical protein [Algibacter amylolyticus]TSJ81586.1 hypothetical protein FPF71_00405 [Algibacter amylolyticus]
MKKTMKNTKKAILMVAFLATVVGFANDSNSLIKKGAKKTAIVLKNVKVGNLLTIKDNYGIVLYKEAIKTEGSYTKGFDLTQLPDGDYVFELEKDLEINTIPFTVLHNQVTFNKTDEVTYFKPYVKQDQDLVYVTKLNPELKETTINVYAINGTESTLRFSEKITNTQSIEKVFKLTKGNFKIEINSGNKEYTTFINN